MTYANAAATALGDLMRSDARIVALGEDLGRGGVFGQYRGLQQEFGADRVIDTPISESNIMGAAVGMALAGMRPVVEMRVIDFALCAIDEIINQAAKNRFMFGGQGRVPLVMRLPIGIWSASAAQHSQSLEAWFAHVPGLVVVTPATPQDNHGLLRAALDSGDPVVYMEHKELWGTQADVDVGEHIPLGRARVARAGDDLTIVTWSRGVQPCLDAAQSLSGSGISAEVIDLRTLWPWDRDAVLSSAARTKRLLVVHEAVQVAGFGAEVAASVAESLNVRVRRLGAPRIPVGYAQPLGKRIAAHPREDHQRRERAHRMTRTAIVTGSASGIGAATVAELQRRGYRTVGMDIAAEPAASVAGAEHRAIRVDVTDEPRLIAAFDEAMGFLGQLDVLVTSAGMADTTPFMELTTEIFRKVSEVNVVATFTCIREAAKRMQAGARICTVASVAGLRGGGLSGTGAYAASKGAVLALTKNAARALAPRGISVNTIAPGATLTPMIAEAWKNDAHRTRVEGMSVLNRTAQPHEMAVAIAFLVSPEATSITGTTLVADNGLVMY